MNPKEFKMLCEERKYYNQQLEKLTEDIENKKTTTEEVRLRFATIGNAILNIDHRISNNATTEQKNEIWGL